MHLNSLSLVNSDIIFLIFLILNSNYFFIMPLYLLFTYFNSNFYKIKSDFFFNFLIANKYYVIFFLIIYIYYFKFLNLTVECVEYDYGMITMDRLDIKPIDTKNCTNHIEVLNKVSQNELMYQNNNRYEIIITNFNNILEVSMKQTIGDWIPILINGNWSEGFDPSGVVDHFLKNQCLNNLDFIRDYLNQDGKACIISSIPEKDEDFSKNLLINKNENNINFNIKEIKKSEIIERFEKLESENKQLRADIEKNIQMMQRLNEFDNARKTLGNQIMNEINIINDDINFLNAELSKKTDTIKKK